MKNIFKIYTRCLKALVMFLGGISAVGIMVMIGIVVVDVALRACRVPVIGAFDLVAITGVISVAAALPYTTAIKGHIAIEYFFQKFNRVGRLLVDTVMRLLTIIFFFGIAWRFVIYGNTMKSTSPTLHLPLFWLPWFLALVFAVAALVTIQHMVEPNKEFIKP